MQLNSYGQIDPKKVDSLARVIDSTAKARRLQQESTIKIADSTYQSELNKTLPQNNRKPNDFPAEKEKKEIKERKVFIVRIVIGVLLFIVLIIVMARRKKAKV